VRTLLILLAGEAMATMDASIMTVAAPSLRADLSASDAQLQLVIAMYTIAFAALVVTGARLGSVLGPRRAFLLGLTAFTAASLAAGLAPSPAALIGARALQGAAAAVMTPQVLSIIQLEFEGERRARAIGAYSLILAVGVAAGQILGGLIVGAHLLAAAWRPALLLNAPVGAALLIGARRGLRVTAEADARRHDGAGLARDRRRRPELVRAAGARRRLDLRGVALLTTALLALVVPLTFGRDSGWPVWVWPCLAAFVRVERRVRARGGDPLFDIGVLALPGVAAGVTTVLLVMGCYSGFLVSLTLHLQGALGFGPLHAGLTFAAYAAGFATVSLVWTRASAATRERLPILGPLAMGAALLAIGLLAEHGGWPAALTTPLLFAGGAGHACGFSPLANRLTAAVGPGQAADLSGLMLTAALVGSVLGVAGFVGIYLGAAPHGSAHALVLTTGVLAAVLVATAACALRALDPTRPDRRRRWLPSARRS